VTRRLFCSALLAGALAAGSLSGGSAPAQAQPRIQGEILVVLAKEEAGEIDATLANVPALRRPPFNSFRSMRVLSRPNVDLRPGQPVEVALPNGRRLQLVLQQVMPDGRYRMRVSINRPNQNDYLPLLQVVASPGDPFFVAGQSYQGGTLVIGVRVGTAAEAAAPAGTPRRRPATRR
jgi:hypothetical protein